MDLAYLARRHRSASAPRIPEPVLGASAPLARYRGGYESLSGWLHPHAAATWSCLFAFQDECGLHGDLMEIGVYKGKSAALIALHAKPRETVVLVDPMLRREATDIMGDIGIPGEVLAIRDLSENLAGYEQVMTRLGCFRWIHIDGQHSLRAVTADLGIAARLLAEAGVICLDDFMSPRYPQITIAALRFLDRLEGGFTLFLCGFGKGYICRTGAAPPYLEYLRDRLIEDLEQRDVRDVMICKTTDPEELNCFGLVPRKDQYRLRGPDWAPDRIRI